MTSPRSAQRGQHRGDRHRHRRVIAFHADVEGKLSAAPASGLTAGGLPALTVVPANIGSRQPIVEALQS